MLSLGVDCTNQKQSGSPFPFREGCGGVRGPEWPDVPCDNVIY